MSRVLSSCLFTISDWYKYSTQLQDRNRYLNGTSEYEYSTLVSYELNTQP